VLEEEPPGDLGVRLRHPQRAPVRVVVEKPLASALDRDLLQVGRNHAARDGLVIDLNYRR
jgi:hypothetical protein